MIITLQKNSTNLEADHTIRILEQLVKTFSPLCDAGTVAHNGTKLVITRLLVSTGVLKEEQG